MRFLLFGTGEYYNRYKIWFDKKDVVALIDNSKEKQGYYIDDILVIAPENVLQYEFDAIIILSFYVKTMRVQLLDLGVSEEKIYHFFDLHDLIGTPSKKCRRECVGNAGNLRVNKKILLLSHDLTLGGPAIALYHAAQALIKKGYHVVYVSMLDGPLRDILTREGIPAVIDKNLMIATMKESDWVREYDFIICNTINFHVFLSEREPEIPVAWWLHDAPFFYDGVRQETMDKLVSHNMKIWSVGPIPEKALKIFRPDFHVEYLLYGVTDQFRRVGKMGQSGRHHYKMCFTVIGYIEYRKGQDILLKAIQRLSPEIRKRARYIFVGENTSLLAKEIMESAKDISEIIISGPVGRNEINCILEQTDILVCPSREDPMPTVAAEAMMHSIPCLISDTAGTAEYIRDGIDGIIFPSENVSRLRSALEDCIVGKFDLQIMGNNARRVYEKYFSMDAFEERLMSLIFNH